MKGFSLQTKAYIWATILTGMGLFGWNMRSLDGHSPWALLLLATLASLALIFKVEGATNRSHYNISFLVYSFTFVLLGAPAAMLIIVISNLVEWAWHKYPWYIQLFNITSYLVVLQAMEWVVNWVNPQTLWFSWSGALSLLTGLAAFTVLNHVMIGVIVWLARGENFSESGIFDPVPLMIDFTMLCMGAATALVWIVNPYVTVLSIIPLYLIYSTLRVPALERKSETDAKTGLYNARHFEQALESELSRADRFDRPLTVVMADLDLLRNINNTYGHLAGDQVLIGVADILKRSVRDYDVVSRFGGEEFAILLPETTPEAAFSRIEAVRNEIEQAEFIVPTSVTPIRATLSFGISGRDALGQTAQDILHNADAALYHSKLKGRNRTFIYSHEVFGLFARSQKSGDSMERAAAGENPLSQAASSPAASTPQKGQPIEKQTLKPGAVRPHARWLVNLFIGGIAFLALFLFGLKVQPAIRFDWVGLIIFACVVVLTEWLSIDIYVRNTAISTSAAPMLAGILTFGPLGALVLSLSFAVVALIKHRSPLSRLIFNASNQMLAGMVYTSLIMFFRLNFMEWSLPLQLTTCLVAAGIVYLITTNLIAIAMGLDLGFPPKQIWKDQFSWLAPYYLVMGLIAFALIFSYETAGLIGTVVMLVPLFLLRFSQEQYLSRTRAIVKELKEKNLILEKSAQEISRLNDGLLNTLAEVIDLRTPYVLGHSKQVTHYAVMLAQKMGLSPERIELIRKASLLHDIGKLGIPDSILLKPTSLSPAEYSKVKEHVILGTEILNISHPLHDLAPIVRHHHERYDGKGYPDRLKGEEIPIESRILGVADAVEAMASDRPYRGALNLQEVLDELRENAGAQFDPVVAQTFLKVIQSEGEAFLANSALAEARRSRANIRQSAPPRSVELPTPEPVG